MPDLTRRQLALVVAAALAAITLAVGIYGLINGPRHDRPASSVGELRSRPVQNTHADAAQARDPSAQQMPRTDDAVSYARAVATALFDWDTASGYLPADYEAPVLADADPSGEETPGLIDDIGTYLPTSEQWLDLATMNVSQTLAINSATVPARWESIAANAHGQLRPGTVAVTIRGKRERTGVWNGEHAAKTPAVAFTVFVACRPSFDRCHILRLSQLDNPLR